MKREQILGLIRHSLTFVGGIYVMRGIIQEQLAQEIVGGIITAIGGIWSVIEKS
jgi:hypothetical protein